MDPDKLTNQPTSGQQTPVQTPTPQPAQTPSSTQDSPVQAPQPLITPPTPTAPVKEEGGNVGGGVPPTQGT